MSNNNSTAHNAVASGDDAEPGVPLSPPKAHRDTSTASSPFVLSTATDDGDSSPMKVKKKGRFTVKTAAVEGEDISPLKAKETIIPQVSATLQPRPNILSPDIPHTPDVDNYDAFGLSLVAAPAGKPETLPPRRHSLLSMQSYDSYISDDSSTSGGLDNYSNEELSPDRKNSELEASPEINMEYSPHDSPEHQQMVGRLLDQSPGKRFQVTFDESATAAQNLSHSYENTVHLIGRHSKESLTNSESLSSSLGGRGTPISYDNEQVQFNNLLPQDQFELLPLPNQQRRSSSVHISSVRAPTLKMRCNSEPLFSPSQSAGYLEANNMNTANHPMEGDRNNWTSYSSSGVYSSDNSESIDEDLPTRMSTPLSMPEGEMKPSGRNVPVHFDSNTSTPTHAGGARQFYSNQQSAQKVAEMQASAPLAHRPYLNFDERDIHFTEGLTPQSTSNATTPISTGGYTEDDDRDHMYWRPNAASFPDLMTDDLHQSRWAMLLYLSMLNLLSGWICFSVAPVATMLEGDVGAESLVSLFLIASAVSTFCAPATLSFLGLRRTVLLGALLLLVGLYVCCASSGFVEGLQVGFIIAGLSQPLYQITPIFVVTAWFPPNEHTAMLRIVLQSNHLGILFSFLCGTFLVSSESDIVPYFQCIILIAMILFIAMVFHFEGAPPTPTPQTNMVFKEVENIFTQQLPDEPHDVALEFTDTNESTGNSDSNYGNHNSVASDFSRVFTEKIKEGLGHRNNFSYGSNTFSYGSIEPSSPFPNLQGSFTPRQIDGQIQALVPQQVEVTPRNNETTIRNDQVLTLMMTYFSKEGSTRCSIAFVTSGVVANSLITFMSYFLGTSTSSKILVGAIGSAFQLFIMISPFIVDKWTDPTHRHSLLSASLLAGVVALMMCMIAMEWESFAGLISSLLVVAFIVGSSQTLSTGRGMEISQMSENSVLIVFQLLSNTLTSMAIPLFRLLQAESIAESAPEFSLPFIFLIAMNMFAATCFFGGNRSSSSNIQQQKERYPFLLQRRTHSV